MTSFFIDMVRCVYLDILLLFVVFVVFFTMNRNKQEGDKSSWTPLIGSSGRVAEVDSRKVKRRGKKKKTIQKVETIQLLGGERKKG